MAEVIALADMFHDDGTITAVEWVNTCPQCQKRSSGTMKLHSWEIGLVKNGETSHLCNDCAELKRLEIERRQFEVRKQELLEYSDIPVAFQTWDKTLGNNKLARTILDNSDKNLFVTGNYNDGKTRSVAFNLLMKVRKGNKCKFYRFGELTTAYARICKIASENAQAFIRNVIDNHQFVVIDDLCKRRITETAGEMLYDVFDHLYIGDCNSIIWCTCNVKLDKLADRFENKDVGQSVVSRIQRMEDLNKMLVIDLFRNTV